jgi:hypothetical protein
MSFDVGMQKYHERDWAQRVSVGIDTYNGIYKLNNAIDSYSIFYLVSTCQDH